jgi:hypothetical protein
MRGDPLPFPIRVSPPRSPLSSSLATTAMARSGVVCWCGGSGGHAGAGQRIPGRGAPRAAMVPPPVKSPLGCA